MSGRERAAGGGRPSSPRPALRALADRLGILPGYRSTSGRTEETSDESREALVAAMGLDGSGEHSAAASLRSLDEQERSRLLPPVSVVTCGLRAEHVRVRRPDGMRPTQYRIELREEDGSVRRAEGRIGPRAGPHIALPVPGPAAPGYHRIGIRLEGGGKQIEGGQAWIVTPPRCFELAPDTRAFGLMAQLYAVRGNDDWGAGDLGDLAGLVDLCAASGAAFVGMNPLHALWNRGADVSPYLPVSRLFRNPLYLEIEAVPELAHCEPARALLRSPALTRERDRMAARESVDYEGVARAKRPLLELLHVCFRERHGDGKESRGRAYRRYVSEQGDALRDFATFVALAEHLGRAGPRPEWQGWPASLRSPGSPEVAAFRAAHEQQVDFHAWLQFELDRQLAEGAARASEAGLAIGLYTDLALGSAAAGSDTWAHPGIFAGGANAGAPPDEFSPDGQDWGFPALDPHRLREDAYAYWIRLLRTGFAHAGALRIDHAMSLTRLFWIPSGRPASEGAYVRYPESDMLGILCLESQRAGGVVIAEDLGTVPAGFAPRLARRGVLSSRVLYFERSGESFRPARDYSSRALVSANTHDLPTLAAFRTGEDLRLRRRVGLIASEAALQEALAERAHSVTALCRRLVSEGLLETAEPLPEPRAFADAVVAFLGRTRAPLLGIALEDLAGEVEAVNLPGAPQSLHPSWIRRLSVDIGQLAGHALGGRLLAVARRERGRSP